MVNFPFNIIIKNIDRVTEKKTFIFCFVRLVLINVYIINYKYIYK